MTIPEDVELDRALRRAVATIPVDVDAGWHDLRRRARRTPARVALWVAVAALVIVSIAVPIRLLAGAEPSLDVTGDAGTGGVRAGEGTTVPDAVGPPATIDPNAPPRPIRLLADLPACAGRSDAFDAWVTDEVGRWSPDLVVDALEPSTAAATLAVTPMPTDVDAACVIALRAGDVEAYELRSDAAEPLARGVSMPRPPGSPGVFQEGVPYLQGFVGSGQPFDTTLASGDLGDRLEMTTSSFPGLDPAAARLVMVERAGGHDADAGPYAVIADQLSTMTLDRIELTGVGVVSSLRPSILPSGFQVCVAAANTPMFGVEPPNTVVYCDQDGAEVRFVSKIPDPGAPVDAFPGLTVEASELAPSAPGRRTILVGPVAPDALVVDVPEDLNEAELLTMLSSIPALDAVTVLTDGGSNDLRGADLPAMLRDELSFGWPTVIDAGSGPAAGVHRFDLVSLDGTAIRLTASTDEPPPPNPVTSRTPLQDRDRSSYRIVDDVRVDLVRDPQWGTVSGAPVVQAMFECGQVRWTATPAGGGAADIEELVVGIAGALPC